MLAIALKMLLHNKVRSITTVVGIAVAFLLSAAQIGLMVGWCNTCSAIIRHADVDVWVMAEQNPAFDYGTPIPRERLYQVLSVPGVAWAETMFFGWMFWQRPDGRVTNVELVGLDDSLVGGPWLMAENDTSVVLNPDAVVIDELYRDQLGIHQIDDEVEIGNQRAVVRGFSSGVRTFTAAPFAFTSFDTAIKYDSRYRDDEVTYVLVRGIPGVSPEQLRDLIAAEVPSTQVLTSAQFASRTILYWMLETGIGITVVATAVLGMFVGAVIVSQALYTITNDHLPNYATLMAIGFSRWKLVGVVLIQAALLGVVGIVIGSAVFGRIAQLSQTSPIPLDMNGEVFGGVLAALFFCCFAASFLSMRSVLRLDPVVVFRN
jgi:putative ABC transport system permease protein